MLPFLLLHSATGNLRQFAGAEFTKYIFTTKSEITYIITHVDIKLIRKNKIMSDLSQNKQNFCAEAHDYFKYQIQEIIRSVVGKNNYTPNIKLSPEQIAKINKKIDELKQKIKQESNSNASFGEQDLMLEHGLENRDHRQANTSVAISDRKTVRELYYQKLIEVIGTFDNILNRNNQSSSFPSRNYVPDANQSQANRTLYSKNVAAKNHTVSKAEDHLFDSKKLGSITETLKKNLGVTEANEITNFLKSLTSKNVFTHVNRYLSEKLGKDPIIVNSDGSKSLVRASVINASLAVNFLKSNKTLNRDLLQENKNWLEVNRKFARSSMGENVLNKSYQHLIGLIDQSLNASTLEAKKIADVNLIKYCGSILSDPDTNKPFAAACKLIFDQVKTEKNLVAEEKTQHICSPRIG